MSPNGRRAWRIAAKKLRRKLGHRWRSQSNWTEQKWRDLVPDLEAHRAHVSGAWFKRHGFTMDDSRYEIRQYIGTWGTVDGDGVEFAIKPASFTPRSLVGMTQGARKRRWAEDFDALPPSGRASKTVSMLRAYGVFPKDGNPLAQRLRPCPGCRMCGLTCGACEDLCPDGTKCLQCGRVMYSTPICDGSGVLPARKATQ